MLLKHLRVSRLDNSHDGELRKLLRVDLLILDDYALQPMDALDTTDIYETTFFPRAYERFCRMLTTTKPFVLAGKVEEDYSAITLTVEEARWLESHRQPWTTTTTRTRP